MKTKTHPETNKSSHPVIIPRLTPYFLAKPVFWFQQKQRQILDLVKKSWAKNQIIILDKDQEINPFILLRELSDFGYQKVQQVIQPGQFAQRGAVIDIFTLAAPKPWRLEFVGNKIENVSQFQPQKTTPAREIQKTLHSLAKERGSLAQIIKPGDYLVHLDHGIGRFAGFITNLGRQSGQSGNYLWSTELFLSPSLKGRGKQKEEGNNSYILLEYAQGDKLYVPLNLSDKLSLYLGFRQPLVHRLGGSLWPRLKKKITQSTLALAQELLKIYTQRETSSGFAFAPDDSQAQELASDFIYRETPDQKQAILDVKKDMESPEKMDRLICGDVGFGKTEVALRAAFKAVMSANQVVLLAPTTILANQHYWTFQQRLERFAVNLALLSRLQTKIKQQEIIQKTSQGQIDILIGTHRVLSPDVHFKNLGLVIIDEEQRFGVRQKEKFKKLRANVDVLSLSATPIPRTLYLALSGLRKISLIQTSPPGRLPIKTSIQPYQSRLIKKAISQELARGGQVYFLHNRIQTIELARQKLETLVKNVKIGIAHGRLSEKELVKVMDKFRQKKIDVLLATTIIENGLDLPNVNTLIVEDATKLGLSQAYQIRGRVGRSSIQAYAYFFYRTRNLIAKAQKRLEALQEAEALGSGYEIAKRDLEIRGSGNILGKEQTGHINAIGLNLYCQMLNEAVHKLKN